MPKRCRIERTRTQELIAVQEQEVLRRQRELEATVIKPAEAERLAAVVRAEGTKQAVILEAEGRRSSLIALAEAEQERLRKEGGGRAAAVEAEGRAEAAKIEAIGLAQAKAIEAQGVAEATAILRKAEAWKEFNDAARLQTILEKLPAIIEASTGVFGAVAAPLGNIDKLVVIDQGGAATENGSGSLGRLARTSPALVFSVLQQLEALGLNVPSIMQQLGVRTTPTPHADRRTCVCACAGDPVHSGHTHAIEVRSLRLVCQPSSAGNAPARQFRLGDLLATNPHEALTRRPDFEREPDELSCEQPLEIHPDHDFELTRGRMETTMANPGSLHDAFIDELRDTYDAEKQLTKALPKLAKAATSPDLRAAFETHLEETRGHVGRLEEVFASLDEKVRGKHCDGIAGIIEEGKAILEEEFDDATMDACLIAAGQRAEHYEMAAYGTLVAWAQGMGHTEAAALLQQTLDEEKAADQKLTVLAEGGINEEAAHTAHSADEEDEDEAEAPSRAGRGGSAVAVAKRSSRR